MIQINDNYPQQRAKHHGRSALGEKKTCMDHLGDHSFCLECCSSVFSMWSACSFKSPTHSRFYVFLSWPLRTDSSPLFSATKCCSAIFSMKLSPHSFTHFFSEHLHKSFLPWPFMDKLQTPPPKLAMGVTWQWLPFFLKPSIGRSLLFRHSKRVTPLYSPRPSKNTSYLKWTIWFSSRVLSRPLISSKCSLSSTVTVPIPSGLWGREDKTCISLKLVKC